MSEDDVNEAVSKHIFFGTVPIRFTLDTLDVPLCFNVSRLTPLTSFIYRTFSAEIGEECNDLWASHNGSVIKIQLPVGVIYDTFVNLSSEFTPLTIDIHTKNFPNDTLLRFSSAKVSSFYFSHLFKESLFLSESNFVVLQQNIGMTALIEKAVLDKDYEQYSLFMGKKNGIKDLWPVKAIKSSDESTVQCFIPVTDGDTIKDALTLKGLEVETVVCHGIKLSVDTPLATIVPQLLYPDGFLYFVI